VCGGTDLFNANLAATHTHVFRFHGIRQDRSLFYFTVTHSGCIVRRWPVRSFKALVFSERK